MIRFAVLGSGSKGNSAVVECGGVRLLIDAGLSAKQLTKRLGLLGIDPDSLAGILLTHEHGDHVGGLKVFLAKHRVPVFSTPATRKVVRMTGLDHDRWKVFETAQTFRVEGAEIRSFATMHDAVDPVGFVISDGTRRLGVLSDAGFVTRSMTDCLGGIHTLFVEANYDEGLLDADHKRPWAIKQRIRSRHGHLSNEQVAGLIREIAHPDLNRIVLGHLSSDCNTPDLAVGGLRDCLSGLGHPHVELHCACQENPTDWFYL
jgi:phosphoribosyl 1,2-cyclic phosphodiesterase